MLKVQNFATKDPRESLSGVQQFKTNFLVKDTLGIVTVRVICHIARKGIGTEIETNRQGGKQVDRQARRQADRHTQSNVRTDRQTDKKTN